MANINKIPPHNLEAEKSVLGSILLEKDALLKISDLLTSADFYHDIHAIIYEAMFDLFDEHQPIDLLTLSDRLKNKGKLEMVGGSTYLAELTESVPTASHIFQYAQIVKNKAVLRRLIESANKILAQGFNEDQDINEALENAEKSLFAVTQSFLKNRFVHIKDVLSDRYEKFAEAHDNPDQITTGVKTGFKYLDNVLNGLKPSEFIVLAARPSMGKTAFALNIAQNIALKNKKSVGIFSLEMSKEQLVDRMFSTLLQVDSWKLHKGKLSDTDFARIGEIMDDLAQANIFIDDSAGANLVEIKSKARRLQMEQGLDLIILDYLQLMSGGTNQPNRVQEISDISRGIKNLARELQVPILALSQLSRAVENRPGRIPQLSDLRESGSIEQDADVVLMMYREDYYEEDSDRQGITDIFIRKNRNGPVGKIELMFKKEQMRFFDVENQRRLEE